MSFVWKIVIRIRKNIITEPPTCSTGEYLEASYTRISSEHDFLPHDVQ